jgi:NAD(P)-dependent dehydrogenase (short-subunit alcohol dehydrogenase family)
LSKGEAAKQKLLSSGNDKTTIRVWEVDMSNYASVQAFSKRVNQLPRLDALLANAGISTNQFHLAGGFEETVTVNVVATFLLCLLVLPRLESSAKENGEPSHLTITGSVVHCFAADKQLQTPSQGKVFATLSKEKEADMAARYFLSKLMVLQGIREMAKKIPVDEKSGGSNVIMNCPNPGWCKTELFRTDDGGF